MSNQQGTPPGWPGGAGSPYGPGQTVAGEPTFDPPSAFPQAPAPGQAQGVPPTNPVYAPMNGPAVAQNGPVPVQKTMDDRGDGYGYPSGAAPGGAPQAYGGAPPGMGMGGPPPVVPYGPPPAPAKSGGGMSLVAIGALAFVLIGGGMTAFFVVRARSAADDKPIPTVDVSTAIASPAEPPGEIPPTPEAPPDIPAALPTVTQVPTAAPPKPTTPAPQPTTPAPRQTKTPPPKATATTPPPTPTPTAATTRRKIPRPSR
jgi:hypothetical protein